MKAIVFLDTNIIIDIIGNREPYCVPAANLLDMAYRNEVKLYATALTYANALYVLRKSLGTGDAMQYLMRLNEVVRIAPTTQAEVEEAFRSGNPDFEDAIQYYSAKVVDANVIITRNPKHFKLSARPVMDATQYLMSLLG